MAHDVEEELSVAQIHTVSDAPGGKFAWGCLNDAVVDLLVGIIKALLQRYEHRFTWMDFDQRLRTPTPDLEVFEIFKQRIE